MMLFSRRVHQHGSVGVCSEVPLRDDLDHDVLMCTTTDPPTDEQLEKTVVPTSSPIFFSMNTFQPTVEETQPLAKTWRLGDGIYGVYAGAALLFLLLVFCCIKCCLPLLSRNLKRIRSLKNCATKSTEATSEASEDANRSRETIDLVLSSNRRIAKLFASLLCVVLVVADLITDVLFSVALFLNVDRRLHYLGIAGLAFTTVPILCNTVLVMIVTHDLTKNRRVRTWIENNDLLTTTIQCLSIFSIETFALAASGVALFSMPLTKYDIYRLRSFAIVNNVLEDIPQLIIVILSRTMYAQDDVEGESEESWTTYAIVSLASSLASLIWTFLFRFQSCSMVYHERLEKRRSRMSYSPSDAVTEDGELAEVSEEAGPIGEPGMLSDDTVQKVAHPAKSFNPNADFVGPNSKAGSAPVSSEKAVAKHDCKTSITLV